MSNFVARYLKNDSGATAIEYGIIASGISLVVVAAVQLIGTDLQVMLTYIGSVLN